MNRRVARRHYSRRTRQIGTVAGGTVAGAGIGSAVGGRRAAVIGGLAGAGASYIYTRRSRSYQRRRIVRRN
jgi:outer membrane lipoprotein SlyB